MLEAIRRQNLINHKEVKFEENGVIEIEKYFNMPEFKDINQEKMYFQIRGIRFKIKNKLTLTLIYLDTSKKANPSEKLEFFQDWTFNLDEQPHNSRYDESFLFSLNYTDKKLWKIKLKIEKYDTVSFGCHIVPSSFISGSKI